MKKFKPTYRLLLALWLSVPLVGCAPQNISLTRDIKTIHKIVATSYPPSEVSKVGGPAVGGLILFGSIGAAVTMISEGNRMVETFALPDFGKLVLHNFLTRARKEFSYWPEVIVEQNEENAKKLAQGQFLLEIKPKLLRVHYIGIKGGLFAWTTAQLQDSNGEEVWRFSFEYYSQDYGRNTNLDQWEENEGKLLKEEWSFAAEEPAKFFSRSMANPELK